MIYRFTIISDEVDDFVREIQIDPEATFYDFHEAILKSAGYTNDQMMTGRKRKKLRWKKWMTIRKWTVG